MSGSTGNNPYRASGVVAALAEGRTGTVDWDTTPKTGTVTAETANGYFVNTTSGAITVNLPAGVAGSIVSMADYARTWDSNNVTVTPNGTDKIGSVNANATLSTEGQSVTFVFVDSTQGWLSVQDSGVSVTGIGYVTATGGCITTSGNYKIHTFLTAATFCVSALASCPGKNEASYSVVAGGGGGGGNHGAGGGAGGYREGKDPGDPVAPSASPLAAACSSLTLTASPYSIAVGAGGGGGEPPAGSPCTGEPGAVSTFSTITSAGGGRGGTQSKTASLDGGSGGGASFTSPAVGTGNTPPTSPAQGTSGGAGRGGPTYNGGGGGGATAAGTAASGASGNGGAGATTSINASPIVRGGGGGGGQTSYGASSGGCGGPGGGGHGGTSGVDGVAGTANTGGGGGGGFSDSPAQPGGNGGKGVVIIRYLYQ